MVIIKLTDILNNNKAYWEMIDSGNLIRNVQDNYDQAKQVIL